MVSVEIFPCLFLLLFIWLPSFLLVSWAQPSCFTFSKFQLLDSLSLCIIIIILLIFINVCSDFYYSFPTTWFGLFSFFQFLSCIIESFIHAFKKFLTWALGAINFPVGKLPLCPRGFVLFVLFSFSFHTRNLLISFFYFSFDPFII